jgi:hypothetical protein
VPVIDKALAAAVKALAAPTLTPYQQTARFSQSGSSCSPFACELTFTPVPAGKRLVVTHASAIFAGAATNAFAFVELTDSSGLPAVLLAPAIGTTPGLYTAGSPVTFYVDAGKSPVLRLRAVGINTFSGTATAGVVGHLVDAP